MYDDVLKKLVEGLKKTKGSLFPTSFAFYMIFALVPSLTIMQFFLSLFTIPADFLQNYLRVIFPNNIATSLIDFLSNSNSWENIISLLFNLFVSVIIISNGFNSFINVSNNLYHKKNNFIKKRLKSLLITIGFIVLLFLFFTLSAVMAYFIGETNVKAFGSVMQIFLEFIMLFILTLLLYSVASDKVLRIKDVWQGALFSAVGITISLSLFGLYSKYLSNFNNSYGPLTWLLILLLLFQLIGLCVYCGLLLNTIIKANRDRIKEALKNQEKNTLSIYELVNKK
ncbi:MAG: YihY/virulence factor BrkB family protein [Erysipelotrichaceae bacterium]|nr:YihY/virulence factor BrkB family protein [Erysipelotrichaceae bacterium]